MPNRLKLEKIDSKPKDVEILSSFRDTIGLDKRPDLLQCVTDIRTAIQNGHALPSGSYRNGLSTTPDQLLQDDGIMHLHLGNSYSRELLFLVQYDSYVVLLEVTDHSHFENDPPGTVLRRIHERKLRELSDLRRRAREKMIKGGIKPRKSKTTGDDGV